jgi:hypothetical protein
MLSATPHAAAAAEPAAHSTHRGVAIVDGHRVQPTPSGLAELGVKPPTNRELDELNQIYRELMKPGAPQGAVSRQSHEP